MPQVGPTPMQSRRQGPDPGAGGLGRLDRIPLLTRVAPKTSIMKFGASGGVEIRATYR